MFESKPKYSLLASLCRTGGAGEPMTIIHYSFTLQEWGGAGEPMTIIFYKYQSVFVIDSMSACYIGISNFIV